MTDRFSHGPKELRENLNRDKERLDSTTNFNFRGDEFIVINRVGERAVTVGLNLLALLRRLGRKGGGGGGVRRAYVKTTPTSGTTVAVYLDTDSTGSEVNVTCDIYDDSGTGGAFSDDTMPNLVDGTPFVVWNDRGTWRNATPIFSLEEC